MAPRQLRLEPIEVDMTAEKGPKASGESVLTAMMRAQLRYDGAPKRLP